MKYWPLFFFLFPLSATVNEPIRCELFSGYRNDRIHWHLQDPGEGGALSYRELYRDVQYWENGLVLKTIHRDLIFFLRGAYGAFGKGDLFQRYELPAEPRFRFATEGWTVDATGYCGYAVNLTPDRTYKVVLTPLVGYSAHFEQLSRNKAPPNPLLIEPIFSIESRLPGDLRLVWNGFFLGGGFLFQPGEKLLFNVGYTYHWVRMRIHTAFEKEILFLEDGDSQKTLYSVKTSAGGNLGHTGWGQFDYQLSRFWRLGFGAQIHYFSSQVLTVNLHQRREIPEDLPQKLKLRWTAVSGWMQLSRGF